MTPKPLGTSNGKSDSELTRFKILWRKMSETARDYWCAQFESTRTQADIRKEIQGKLKIRFTYDSQLTAFRHWLCEQGIRDHEAALAQEDEVELKKQGLTGDALRAVLLDRMKTRALLFGDFKLGLAALKVDLKASEGIRDERKLAIQEKKAAAYDRAQAALDAAKKSKGGITPETLKQIETELRLL